MKIRRHKYGAVRTVVDGISFQSKREAARYQELKLLEKAGEIHGLVLQPHYHLTAGLSGVSVGKYIADFEYCECRRGDKCARSRVVTEDAKGFKTPLYRWKRKHVEAQYGIEIREV